MNRDQLQKRFHHLESTRQELLRQLVNVDQSILYHQPAPGKWNIAQIIYHLDFAEVQSLKYISKKMLGGSALKRTGSSADMRSLFLKWLLLSGYKWKAPAVLGDVPADVQFENAVATWDETRKRLQELINVIPEDMIDREIYKHVRAGRLNLIHMMHFFQDHFDHHIRQIRKLLQARPG